MVGYFRLLNIYLRLKSSLNMATLVLKNEQKINTTPFRRAGRDLPQTQRVSEFCDPSRMLINW